MSVSHVRSRNDPASYRIEIIGAIREIMDGSTLSAKEGVTFLAPQREVESREPEGSRDSSLANKIYVDSC
jgi:hypothetical protein